MIKHIILWRLDDKLSESEKNNVKQNAKKELEALVGVIPGLISMSIQVDSVETSSADMMLDSTFESIESLRLYKDHPEHIRVANGFVRPYTVQRLCLDFNS